jgi:SAM-dependent methyltransferase
MSSNQTPDPDAFRDFEHAGWTSNVSEYEAGFARLTRQAVAPLLDAVNLRHGARLLDVATGPGYVAAAAAARGARALGVDFSAPMVAHARAINPAVEFQEGDAEALSFEDCSLDAVFEIILKAIQSHGNPGDPVTMTRPARPSTRLLCYQNAA